MSELPALRVSDFVAVLNQTLEFAYPSVVVTGEIANFRISKNRWVYFDLKDEAATVRFFGTVYQLPGPLEDGMTLAVRGVPRLHQLYGFSVNIQSMTPTGEGSIKKAAALLEAKLKSEGLFDESRKRPLPYPPRAIGLVTSGESAAYRDFIKIINARWGGVEIVHVDVQVQGEPAAEQIVAAIAQLNQLPEPPEAIVVTRGGGSAEDLQVFSTEQVTRAVAMSRIPTVVAIGHEVDISLAELAADRRASTPSNAAELLVPDRQAVLQQLALRKTHLTEGADHILRLARQQLHHVFETLGHTAERRTGEARQQMSLRQQVLSAFDPSLPLQRGYALVRQDGKVVNSRAKLTAGAEVDLQFSDGTAQARVV